MGPKTSFKNYIVFPVVPKCELSFLTLGTNSIHWTHSILDLAQPWLEYFPSSCPVRVSLCCPYVKEWMSYKKYLLGFCHHFCDSVIMLRWRVCPQLFLPAYLTPELFPPESLSLKLCLMSETIHVEHVVSGSTFLWLHKNSSSPRDTTFSMM